MFRFAPITGSVIAARAKVEATFDGQQIPIAGAGKQWIEPVWWDALFDIGDIGAERSRLFGRRKARGLRRHLS